MGDTSKIVRLGILGTARIAKAALIDAVSPTLGAPDAESTVEVTAVASRTLAAARSFADQHAIAKAYASYAEMLADESLDAIYNPLPNALHAEWTIRALEAGKAVLCEKPLAANATQAKAMEASARASGRPLMEAFHYRFHPFMREVEALMRTGAYGPIRRIAARLEIPGKLLARDDIRFRRDLAGGALMDVGAYCANALRTLVGQEPGVIDATATCLADDVDGAMRARLSFPGGADGALQCSLIAERLCSEVEIITERAVLRLQNPFLPHLGHKLTIACDGEVKTSRFDMTPSYLFQAKAFGEAVRGRAPVLTTPADGVANMGLIDAIYCAAGLPPRG
jgi:predicted dehydrogenase